MTNSEKARACTSKELEISREFNKGMREHTIASVVLVFNV
jgi:hypothetical protein